jgi:hypothetical protein
MIKQPLALIFERDLNKLKEEINLYKEESNIWKTEKISVILPEIWHCI